jgi:hypothetical protein
LKNTAIDRSVRGGVSGGAGPAAASRRPGWDRRPPAAARPAPEAAPDDHGGVVAGAADGLRQGVCMGGEPERSPVGRLVDPRRVDLDDRRSGFKGGGRLRVVPVDGRCASGDQQDTRFARADGGAHRTELTPTLQGMRPSIPWSTKLTAGAAGIALLSRSLIGVTTPTAGCRSECRGGLGPRPEPTKGRAGR